jgi:serine/threonine protein kinase
MATTSPERRKRAPPGVAPLSADALRASELGSVEIHERAQPQPALHFFGEIVSDSVVHSPQGLDAPSVIVDDPTSEDATAAGRYRFQTADSTVTSPSQSGGPFNRTGGPLAYGDCVTSFANATESFDKVQPVQMNNFFGLRAADDIARFAAVDPLCLPSAQCAVDEEAVGAFLLLAEAMESVLAADPAKGDSVVAHAVSCFRSCVARMPSIIDRLDGKIAAVSINADTQLRRNSATCGDFREASVTGGPLGSPNPRWSAGVTIEAMVAAVDVLTNVLASDHLQLSCSASAEYHARAQLLSFSLVRSWRQVRRRFLAVNQASTKLVKAHSVRFLHGDTTQGEGLATSAVDMSGDEDDDFTLTARSWCLLLEERRSEKNLIDIQIAPTVVALDATTRRFIGGVGVAIFFLGIVSALFSILGMFNSSEFSFTGGILALVVAGLVGAAGLRWWLGQQHHASRSALALARRSLAVACCYRTPIAGGVSSSFVAAYRPPAAYGASEEPTPMQSSNDVFKSGFMLTRRSNHNNNNNTAKDGALPSAISASLLGSVFEETTRTSVAQRRPSATPNPLSQMLPGDEPGVVRVRMDATGTLLLPFMDDTANPIVLDGFHVHAHLSIIGVEFSVVYGSIAEQRAAAVPDDRCYVCLWNHAIVSATGGFTDRAVLSNNLNDVLEDGHSVRQLAQRIAAIEAEVLEPHRGFTNDPLVLSFLHREHGAIKMRLTVAPVTQCVVTSEGDTVDVMVGALLIGVPLDVRASIGGMTLRNRFLGEAVEQLYLEATALAVQPVAGGGTRSRFADLNEITLSALFEALSRVAPMNDSAWKSCHSRCFAQELPAAIRRPNSHLPGGCYVDGTVPEVIDVDLAALESILGALASRAAISNQGFYVHVAVPTPTSSLLIVRVVGLDCDTVASTLSDTGSGLVAQLRAATSCVVLTAMAPGEMDGLSAGSRQFSASFALPNIAKRRPSASGAPDFIECVSLLFPFRRSTGGEAGWVAHVAQGDTMDSPVLRRQGSLRNAVSQSFSAMGGAGGSGTQEPMSVMLCFASEIERHKVALALWNRSHCVIQVEDDNFFIGGHRMLRSGQRRIDAVIFSRRQPLVNDLVKCCIEFPEVCFVFEQAAESYLSPSTASLAPPSIDSRRVMRRQSTSAHTSDSDGGGMAYVQQRLSVMEVLRQLPNVSFVTRPSHSSQFASDLVSHITKNVGKLREQARKREAIEALLKERRQLPWVKGRRLGKGTFGDVHEAQLTLTGGTMAVKTMHLGGNEAKRQALLNEIKVLLAVQHPNIVHYFHSERGGDGEVHIFMELCAGGSLANLLSSGTIVDVAEAAVMMEQIIAALEYMHVTHNLAHRDLKPANVLLSGGKIKLADFGTAVAVKADDMQVLELAGTMQYMAPEVFAGEMYGKPCDVWSTGVILLDLLRVVPPVMGKPHISCLGSCESDAELWEGLSLPTPAATDFLRRCLRVKASDRATPTELLQDPFIKDAWANFAAGGTKAASAKAPELRIEVVDHGALSISGGTISNGSGPNALIGGLVALPPVLVDENRFEENANQWKSRFMHSGGGFTPANNAAQRLARPAMVAASPAARSKLKRQSSINGVSKEGAPLLLVPSASIPATAVVVTAASPELTSDASPVSDPGPSASAVFANVRNDGIVVQDSQLSDF